MRNFSLWRTMETVYLDNKGPHESLKEDLERAGEAQ